MEFVSYKPFGAKGDGVTDDAAAIAAAHAYANEHGLPVKTEVGVTFRIARADAPIRILTDTDWTGSTVLLDDTGVPAEEADPVFEVHSRKKPYTADTLHTLKKFQPKLDITLPEPSLIIVEDNTTRRYLRGGSLADSGSPQNDMIVADPDGNVDMRCPIMWDYDRITSMQVIPMDEETLTLKGGTFITRTAAPITKPRYYNRGIRVFRSNTVVDGLRHLVENEDEMGAPYSGFLSFENCANVTMKNCVVTPHRTFRYTDEAGRARSMGTYAIMAAWTANLTFENCTQTVDICDNRYWGVMGTNYCKNITMKNCTFSRFDAHQGVANVTISGCTLGYCSVETIGLGTFLMEDTTNYGLWFIALRTDYGAHWEGEMTVRRCRWIPHMGQPINTPCVLISGNNFENHNFGYDCTMPHTVTLEDVFIDDTRLEKGGEIFLLATVNTEHTDGSFRAEYPYRVTERLRMRNVRTASGRECSLSMNPYLYRNLIIEKY